METLNSIVEQHDTDGLVERVCLGTKQDHHAAASLHVRRHPAVRPLSLKAGTRCPFTKYLHPYTPTSTNHTIGIDLLYETNDACRQVIANMTVGKDVAMLFTDVINCIQTGERERRPILIPYPLFGLRPRRAWSNFFFRAFFVIAGDCVAAIINVPYQQYTWCIKYRVVNQS